MSSATQYSLYWSGYTLISNFSGDNNNSFLSVWEGSPFIIQLTRLPESSNLIKGLGKTIRFDGRLRSVALSFRKYSSENSPENIIIGGNLVAKFLRGNRDKMLPSHNPNYTIKAGSFWEEEHGQKSIPIVLVILDFYPGCLNSTDKQDYSNVELNFPMGLPSAPRAIMRMVFSVFSSPNSTKLASLIVILILLIRILFC